MRAHRLLVAAALSVWMISGTASAGAEGKRLSFDFQQADLHNVLRILAEAGHLNLIVPDELSGRVTLRLRNVLWSDAFEAVLAANGLGAEKRGNIVRIARLTELAAEAETRVKLKKAKELEGPLVTQIIPVNYARAADLLPHVQSMLSPRGTATVDVRTNVIIVRDIESFDPNRF